MGTEGGDHSTHTPFLLHGTNRFCKSWVLCLVAIPRLCCWFAASPLSLCTVWLNVWLCLGTYSCHLSPILQLFISSVLFFWPQIGPRVYVVVFILLLLLLYINCVSIDPLRFVMAIRFCSATPAVMRRELFWSTLLTEEITTLPERKSFSSLGAIHSK